MDPILNYINGEYVKPSSNDYIDVIDPAIGEKYTVVANSNKNDIDKAVNAAKESFLEWSALSIKDRSNFLTQIANEIEKNLDEFAYLETKDTGKPIRLSKKIDIPRAISNFRFFAEHAKSFHFESKIHDENSSNLITRSPLGVVGCISPWNLPLYLFTWKIAPALISGNTVVAKPSEISPLTANKLGQILTEINFPKGVINIVNGDGNIAGQEIVRHPNIKAISFTGGTNTGSKIAQDSSSTLKKLSLENEVAFLKNIDSDLKIALIAEANLFLMPSRVEKKSVEGFGISYIEAGSYGVGSIGGKDGGASDAIAHNKT